MTKLLWNPVDHALLIAKFEGWIAASAVPNPMHVDTLAKLKDRTAAEMDAYVTRKFKAKRDTVNHLRTPGEIRAWYELAAKVVYPITKADGGGYLVTSLIRQDVIRTTGELAGQPLIETWPCHSKAAAEAKVDQLIHWDWESRTDKHHGCILADIAKWSVWGEARVAA